MNVNFSSVQFHINAKTGNLISIEILKGILEQRNLIKLTKGCLVVILEKLNFRMIIRVKWKHLSSNGN